MLSRIAHICTFLTLGLLTVILGLGAVAIHDFNHPDLTSGDSHIFVREYERHGMYMVGLREERHVGYQINYTVCGQPASNYEKLAFGNGKGKVLKSTPPIYGYATRLSHFPGVKYEPMPDGEVYRLGLSLDHPEGQHIFTWGTVNRRVCQINLTGIWDASKNLLASL